MRASIRRDRRVEHVRDPDRPAAGGERLRPVPRAHGRQRLARLRVELRDRVVAEVRDPDRFAVAGDRAAGTWPTSIASTSGPFEPPQPAATIVSATASGRRQVVAFITPPPSLRDALRLQSRSFAHLANGFDRPRLEHVQARLVLGDGGRPHVANGMPIEGELARSRSRPTPRGGRRRGGRVRLDEESGHVRDARAARRRWRFGEPLQFGQPSCECGARADAELRVDARQLGLDRLRRHEERRGDFLVRAALGDELGDAALGRRQHAFGAPSPADAPRARSRALARPRPRRPSDRKVRSAASEARARASARRLNAPQRHARSAWSVRARSNGSGASSWSSSARANSSSAASLRRPERSRAWRACAMRSRALRSARAARGVLLEPPSTGSASSGRSRSISACDEVERRSASARARSTPLARAASNEPGSAVPGASAGRSRDELEQAERGGRELRAQACRASARRARVRVRPARASSSSRPR